MWHRPSLSTTLSYATMCLVIAACAGPTAGPDGTDFAYEEDVRRLAATDSVGVPLPPPGTDPTGPGVIRGFVRAAGGAAGGDTLSSSPRLSGVVVRAFPVISASAAVGAVSPTVLSGTGPLAAQGTTDVNGAFALPQLPGGLYKVSFQPPGETYVWAWVYGEVHGNSEALPWWVTLFRR